MRVTHLFDAYLPATLSWVRTLLREQRRHVGVSVAAPWIVQRLAQEDGLDAFIDPLQQTLFPSLHSEWQYPRWQYVYRRMQRYVPLYPFFLEKKLRRARPDILHAHYGPTACLYAPMARRLQIPLVATFYGFDYTKTLIRHPIFRKKYLRLFEQAAAIFTASSEGASKLAELGCPADKISIFQPSVDLEHFAPPRNRPPKTPHSLRLIQLATFTAKKGHMDALEAFALALSDCPNMRLVMTGEPADPDLVAALQRRIDELGIGEHARISGPIPHAEAPALLGRFDAFIHPSCTAPDGDHEASPMALAEAQAVGLPAIATTHFDIPRRVVHQHTGLLAPERDIYALAAHIRRFYRMEAAEYAQFSQNARRHIEHHLDIRRTAQWMCERYAGLCAS